MAVSSIIKDLVTNPEKSGKAEIDAAPIKQNIAVRGIVRQSPPSSDAFDVPVRNITAPTLMNKSALYRICANACDAVPLRAISVPTPIPTTMKPN